MGANDNFMVTIYITILGGVKDISRFTQMQTQRVKKIWR